MTFETVIIYRFKSYYIWYMYDSGNNVIGFEYSQLSEINETLKTTRIYYEKNLQGDVTGLLDARGAKIASYTYDAWGNVITDTEKSFCYEGYEVPFELNHVLYRGYYYDGSYTDTESDTNLYYLQSRYYDAEVGRIVNADDAEMINITVGTILKHNIYLYCNGNPIRYVDKDGRIASWIAGAACGALIAYVLYKVECYLGIRKYSLASCIAICATNAALSAWIWGMIGGNIFKIKRYVGMVQKAGAGTLEIKLLRAFYKMRSLIVNMVVKSFGKRKGESWFTAIKRFVSYAANKI